MEANLPVWKYYEKDFIDPLYALYQQKLVPGINESTGRKVGVNINPYKRATDPMISNPLLEQRGWGLSFQRQFSNDPCPAGWTPGTDGWCFMSDTENDLGIFYTDKAYIAPHQYWLGYTEPATASQGINNFDIRSVSPFTGHFQNKPPSYMDVSIAGTYNRSPVPDSYVPYNQVV